MTRQAERTEELRRTLLDMAASVSDSNYRLSLIEDRNRNLRARFGPSADGNCNGISTEITGLSENLRRLSGDITALDIAITETQ